MILVRKPISIQYIEKCLISPPIFPGGTSLPMYIREETLRLNSRMRTLAESSEIFGEIIGGVCGSTVTGTCIAVAAIENSTPKVQRRLRSALDRLQAKNRQIMVSIPEGLDLEMVKAGAKRGLNHLLSGCEDQVILQSEINVDENFRKIRFYSLNIFGEQYLTEKYFEGVQAYIDFRAQ